MTDDNQFDINAMWERGMALNFSSFSLPAMDELINHNYKVRIAH